MIIGSQLVTVRELSDHINEPIESEADKAQARSFIREASANVRSAGDSEWTRLNCPEVAFTIALAAAARGYLNPAGYDSERSDTNNLNRGERATNGTQLTREEKADLKKESGRTNLVTSVRFTRPDRISDDVDSDSS